MFAALVKKELLALARDVHGLAVLFLMPAIFIVVMSLALRDVYSPPQVALRYALDVRDSGRASQEWQKAWRTSHGEPVALPADWQQQLQGGALKYVIVFDTGLSEALKPGSPPVEPAVRLIAEPGIDSNVFNSLRAELNAVASEFKWRAALGQAEAPQASAASSATAVPVARAERYESAGRRPTSVQQNVPAWLVFGMFFVVTAIAGLFIQERSAGTLARLRSMGVPRYVLLASKAVPYLGVTALQAALMLAVGVWLMPLLGGDALSLSGIDWAALALAIGAISAAAVSLALMLATLVRTHAQASAIGPILNVLMAAIGGIMVPVFVMPHFMQELARLSPMNWGLEALLTVLLRGDDVAATLPHAARLLVFAAVMLLIAALLFRRASK